MKKWFLSSLAGAILIGSISFASAEPATFYTESSFSCTNSTQEALAENLGRVAALFTNNGTTTIWLGINGDAATTGIRLNANGGSYYITYTAGNFSRDEVDCITASAIVVLSIQEWNN